MKTKENPDQIPNIYCSQKLPSSLHVDTMEPLRHNPLESTVSNLDAEAHIKTAAGQLICQTETLWSKENG